MSKVTKPGPAVPQAAEEAPDAAVTPSHRIVYVKWRRESGDWVGETSLNPFHFRIEQRIHGKYLVNHGHREEVSTVAAAKEEAERRAQALGCAPFTVKLPVKPAGR